MMNPNNEQPQIIRYQISVEGKFRGNWSDWFNGMEISTIEKDPACITTILEGVVADQSKLRGILNKLWDLNLVIISMSRVLPNSKKEGNNV